MSAIPTDPDSVYAVILCFGQGDAARQALRDNPLYVMQVEQGVHAGGEHAASLSRAQPPAPLRHSLSLPTGLASRRAMDTDTPIPDGADLEHANAGNDNEDEPNASLEHLPLLAAEPAGDPEPFAPQIHAPATVLVQEGLAPGQGVLGQFLHDEPDDVDGMEDDDDLPGLDGFLLDLDDGAPVADNLPTALEALIGTTTLLQLNELPQHPNLLQLVTALYTALVHYMQQHGLPLNIQPLAIAAAQEQEAQLDDFVDPNGPVEDEEVDDNIVNQDDEYIPNNDALAYAAEEALGPDAGQHADPPALIAEPAEAGIVIADAALEHDPSEGTEPNDVERTPRTDAERDVNAVIRNAPLMRDGDGGPPATERLDPNASVLEPQTQTGADALSWIHDRFSLEGGQRTVDNALIQAANQLKRLERRRTARLSSDDHDPQDARADPGSSHADNGEKATRGRKLLRSFVNTMKWKSLGKRLEVGSRPDLLPSSIPVVKQ
ncbi:hypothetical protein PENSPDRAFT_684119 [Peniophora sp. CONT]|nr:hypothetical protein PENSPDRAFT_684119 [Peniophora sp. CONT]